MLSFWCHARHCALTHAIVLSLCHAHSHRAPYAVIILIVLSLSPLCSRLSNCDLSLVTAVGEIEDHAFNLNLRTMQQQYCGSACKERYLERRLLACQVSCCQVQLLVGRPSGLANRAPEIALPCTCHISSTTRECAESRGFGCHIELRGRQCV